MFTDIPRVDDLEPTTEEAYDGADQGYTKNLNEDVEALVPNPEEKKSKNRKLRKLSEAQSSEPKQKLTREEKAAKKARKAEKKGEEGCTPSIEGRRSSKYSRERG
ncbi:hypothetical protein LIER_27248 [Lithospermum erythrorhizon]|uniref:Uncharacterized protein n=1 Tax=Lithospermum erythrorhizon TaxID=34254 RepID=A0AAV3RH86_LITER